MSTPSPCPECGALPTGLPRSTCEYCGARLTAEATPSERARGDRAARLDAVERHPDFAAAMGHTPELRGHMVGGYVGTGCFGAFSALTGLVALCGLGVITLGDLGPLASTPAPVLIVPGLMSAVTGFVALQVARKTREFKAAPLERRPALVRDERSRSREKSTSYFATLEFADGHREEFPVSAEVASRAVRDDVGVAYLKGGVVLDFRRIDV